MTRLVPMLLFRAALAGRQAPTGCWLLADQGSVLIATSGGVFRAFGADSLIWVPALPAGLGPPAPAPGFSGTRRDAGCM